MAGERIQITSIFQTLRPCLRCGAEFYPPKRADRLILDYCSPSCEKGAGLRPMRREPTPIRQRRTDTRPRRLRQSRTDIVRSGFAMRLIEHRLRMGMSQRALAIRLGIHYNLVNFWETDRHDPSVRNLQKLADLFGVSMDMLWRGKREA